MYAQSQPQPQGQQQQRSQSHPRSHSQRNSQPHAFEFTKRKKWADILVADLPDTVYLVLDVSGNIQYAGPGVTDLLGWQPEELVEKDMLDLVNDEDRIRFTNRLHVSLKGLQDLSCYARLKRCSTANVLMGTGDGHVQQSARPKELLFEIRGHALFIPEDKTAKSFFVMAKPYPSRNRAMLNTFFELKIENERLTQRLNELKLQETPGLLPQSPSSATLTTVSQSQYTHGSSHRTDGPPMCNAGSRDTCDSKATQDTAGLARLSVGGSTSNVSINAREDSDEGGKKKKLKKYHASDTQLVCFTCGRTDSPEWRKGPSGPKTLCNACGLRWAKRTKKPEDVNGNFVTGLGGATLGFNSDAGFGPSERERDGKEGIPSPGSAGNGNGSGCSGSNGGKRVPVVHAALSVTPVPRNGPSHVMIQQQRTGTPSVSIAASLPVSSTPVRSLDSPHQYVMHQLGSASAGMAVVGSEAFADTLGLDMTSGILTTAPLSTGMDAQPHHLQCAQVHTVQGYMPVASVADEFTDANIYDGHTSWNISGVCRASQGVSAQQAHSDQHMHQQPHHQLQGHNLPFSNY